MGLFLVTSEEKVKKKKKKNLLQSENGGKPALGILVVFFSVITPAFLNTLFSIWLEDQTIRKPQAAHTEGLGCCCLSRGLCSPPVPQRQSFRDQGLGFALSLVLCPLLTAVGKLLPRGRPDGSVWSKVLGVHFFFRVEGQRH